MKKLNIILFIAYFFSISLSAQWVWSPNDGWISTDYNVQRASKKLLENGKKLQEKGNLEEAKKSFLAAWKYYPDTLEGKEAILILANIEFEQKNYHAANIYYDEFLKKNPFTGELRDIYQKKYQIGRGIVRESTEGKEKGVDILRDVISTSNHEDFVDDAQMTIADYYYSQKRYDEAITEYQTLIKKYPKSEWTPSAQYLLATSFENKYRGVEHEVKPLLDAKKELDKYIELYPENKYIPQAEKKKKEINEKIVLKDIAIAEFYIVREEYHSAKIYLRYIIKTYPKTRAMQKAKLLLKDIAKE